VVNFLKYRAIRNEEDRREQNRAAQERWREKQKAVSHSKPRSADSQPDKPIQIQIQKQIQEDIVPTALVVRDDAYRPPDCPFQELLAAYHKNCPSLPAVRVLTNMRMKHARCRWVQVCADEKWGKDEALDWFAKFFRMVEKSAFLTGRAAGNKRSWRADFEWLMNAGNFAKVVEEKYQEAA
jgi:hypothetical protein